MRRCLWQKNGRNRKISDRTVNFCDKNMLTVNQESKNDLWFSVDNVKKTIWVLEISVLFLPRKWIFWNQRIIGKKLMENQPFATSLQEKIFIIKYWISIPRISRSHLKAKAFFKRHAPTICIEARAKIHVEPRVEIGEKKSFERWII